MHKFQCKFYSAWFNSSTVMGLVCSNKMWHCLSSPFEKEMFRSTLKILQKRHFSELSDEFGVERNSSSTNYHWPENVWPCSHLSKTFERTENLHSHEIVSASHYSSCSCERAKSHSSTAKVNKITLKSNVLWFYCIPWPWKHRSRDQFYPNIFICCKVFQENRIFNNGGANLHNRNSYSE